MSLANNEPPYHLPVNEFVCALQDNETIILQDVTFQNVNPNEYN